MAEASSKPEINLPCEIVDNLCYLQSRLNESPADWFVLDSGSSYSVIDAKKAAADGFNQSGSGQTSGGAEGGDNHYGIINGVTIYAGAYRLDGQTIISLPFEYVAQRVGHPTAGTLGSNLFRDRVVGIDYLHQRVTLSRPENWQAEGHGAALPITVEGNVPFVRAKVSLADGQQIEGKFLVDSGQIVAGVVITEPFRKAHPEVCGDKPLVHLPSIAAVGGTMEYTMGRIPQLQLGSSKIVDPIVCFPERAVGTYARTDLAGAIGADVLSRFDLVFDYAERRLFLKPNADFSKPFPADASGLQLGVAPLTTIASKLPGS